MRDKANYCIWGDKLQYLRRQSTVSWGGDKLLYLGRKVAELGEEPSKISEASDDGGKHVDDLNAGTLYVALLQVGAVGNFGVRLSVVQHRPLHLIPLLQGAKSLEPD